MVDMANPSGLEIALDGTDGTVTAFLEGLVGERVDAHVRRQRVARAGPSNRLAVDEGHPVLLRSAVLTGRVSDHPYVYAETVLVLSRLPARFRERIEAGFDPIGRILTEEGIEVTREVLTGPVGDLGSCSAGPPVVADPLLHRTYRVDLAGSPAMLIAEWFLHPLQRFLTHNGW
jgi:chorismate-pyruvate lyase